MEAWKHLLSALLPLLAVLVSAAALNAWVMRHPMRIDLTDAGVYSVAPETKAVLKALHEPVEVRFFYDTRSRAMQDARLLLEQFATLTSLLDLKTFDPMLEPAVAEAHGVRFAGTAIFRTAKRTVRVANPTETEFINALIRVTSDAVGKICFTDGHVESNPFSLQTHDHFESDAHSHHHGGDPLELHERHGMGKARNALEVMGFTLEQKILSNKDTALTGCEVVVVASPQIAIPPAEAAVLANYLVNGGAVLLMLEPGVISGLEPLLDRRGIQLSTAAVRDPQRHYWTDPGTPAVTDYPRHRITRRLPLTFFPGAAALSRRESTNARGTRITPLLQSSEEAAFDDRPKKTKGTKTLGILVNPIANTGNQDGPLIVIGDGDFATNSFFDILGNGQLFLNLVRFLSSSNALMELTPRNYAVAQLALTNRQFMVSFVLTVFLGPVLLGIVGLLVWRRR